MSTSQGSSEVVAPGLKIASAWAAVGITSWAEAASFVAFVYTVLLLADFFWKKIGRDFCVRRGWMKPQRRRQSDHDGWRE